MATCGVRPHRVSQEAVCGHARASVGVGVDVVTSQKRSTANITSLRPPAGRRSSNRALCKKVVKLGTRNRAKRTAGCVLYKYGSPEHV